MSSNLIQNYIASKSAIKTKPQVPSKPKPNFDIQKELDNRTFIKPLRGKGKLINENPFSMPQTFVSDINYNIKALKHAIKGNANDHELGKLNDVGLMGGMLAIASYLSSKRTTGVLKGMEFIGPAAFLASMTLWPKIAIQLPAYLIHGVNVQKQYQDSFGRTKPFYQDPQFIPWDLYSDEQIQKIGDRMGVPNDIPNRRDFIQEKMRKLAIQNNTLWMLTAGFATPVMASLICNAAQPHYARYLDEIKNKKADKILADFDNYALKKYKNDDILHKIQELRRDYSGKHIDDKLVEKISQIFTEDLDAVTSESMKKDVKELLFNGKYSINEQTAKNVCKNLFELLEQKGYSEEFIKAVAPTEEQMLQIFSDNSFYKDSSKLDIKQIIDKIILDVVDRAKVYNTSNTDQAEDIRQLRRDILSGNSTYDNLKDVKANLFDKEIQKKLINTAKIFDSFRAKSAALDEYAVIKVGSAPETVIANYWNDVSKDLLKSFGFTDKELELVRFDSSLLGKMLREKLDTIASDRNSYERVMNILVEKISKINNKIKPSDITSHLLKGDTPQAEPTAYETKVDSVYDNFASSIKSQGFSRTAEAVSGKNGDAFGTAKAIQKAFVEERMLGVKSSFYRLINTLDFYRRVATNPNDLRPFNKISREVKEELIELCKIVSLSGHSSDFSTKFYMMRNPNPEKDMSPIEIENGKIKYKYVGKDIGRTDIPVDKYFYQNGMNFLYGENMHPETRAIIEKFSLTDEISNYRNLVMDYVGGEHYFWKPRHKVRDAAQAGSDIKFLLTGISPNELFFKSGQQVYNSKKWLKMFGGFGIGLLGVTVLAQFFLGRLKAPKKAGKHD